MVKKKMKKVTATVKSQGSISPVGVQCSCNKRQCLKRLFVLIFGIIIGAVVCCNLEHCPRGFGKGMFGHKARFEKKFINGCLDTSSIGNTARLEKIQLKDADKNGCITEEEFSGAKKMRSQPRVVGKR